MELKYILCAIIICILICFGLKCVLKHRSALFFTAFSFVAVILSIYFEYQFGGVSIFGELTQMFTDANCAVEGKGNFLCFHTRRNVTKIDALHRFCRIQNC